MEPDERIRRTLLENLSKFPNVIRNIYRAYIELMREAQSVEEIMLLEKSLLVDLLDMLPLTAGECYFCILHDKCEECEYGWKHGMCADYDIKDEEIKELVRQIRDKVENDFDLVRFLAEALKYAIKRYYYSGEVYGDEEPMLTRPCMLCGKKVEVPISTVAKDEIVFCEECRRRSMPNDSGRM